LESDAPLLSGYHDVFVRYHVEVLLANYFKDVTRNMESLSYPAIDLRNTNGCIRLLKEYCGSFMKDFHLKETQPHYVFYGSEGVAQRIEIDAMTSRVSTRPTVYFDTGRSGSMLHASSQPSRSNPLLKAFPNGATVEPPKPRAGSITKRYCIFHFANQLAMVKDGNVVRCMRGCVQALHVGVEQVSLEVVIAILNALPWSVEVKGLYSTVFYANSKKFKK
jgi:hypothetical protein